MAASAVIFEAGLLVGITAGLPHMTGTLCNGAASGQRITGESGKSKDGAKGGKGVRCTHETLLKRVYGFRTAAGGQGIFVVEYTNTIGKSMDAATMMKWKIFRN